ncbi:MAG: T9SS type A sorting domain-containing protein [Bacteroidia bacterium]
MSTPAQLSSAINAATTGIFDNKQEELGISVFPVPVIDGTLTVLSASKALNIIEVYNIAGQLVLTTDANGPHSKQISVRNLNTGIYFIKVGELGHTKFIIK